MHQLLPDTNFYCFKLDEEFDEDREEKELKELERLVEDAISHKGRIAQIDDHGTQNALPVLPIILEPQFRDQMLRNLEMLLDLCTE